MNNLIFNLYLTSRGDKASSLWHRSGLQFLMMLATVICVSAILPPTAEAAGAITERRLLHDTNGNGRVDGDDRPLAYQQATLHGLVSGVQEHYARPLQQARSDFAGIVRFSAHPADGQSVIVENYSCESHENTMLCVPAFNTRAAAIPGTIYFIYFVPNDRSIDPQVRDRIFQLARQAQNNYRDFVGSTFPIYYKALVIEGEQNRAWYSETPDGVHSRCEFYYLGNVWNEVKDKIGGVDWDPNHRYVIYHDIDICAPANHYAAANLGTAQLPATATATQDLFAQVGSMVTNHELGHALNLPHDASDIANCMFPTVQDIFPCLFNAGQTSDLLANNPGFWGSGGLDRELPDGSSDDEVPELFITGNWFDEGGQRGELKMRLSGPSSETVSVGVYTTPETASGHGVDYYGFTQIVSFAPNEVEKTVEIGIVNDGLPEPDEDLRLQLFNPVGMTLNRKSALVRILDDDADVLNAVYIESASVLENIGAPVNVTVRLSSASASTVTVKFKTEDSQALNGIDYYGNYQELRFAPGETRKVVQVTVINDQLREPDKRIALKLFAPENAVLIDNGMASLKILDDESR